MKSEYNMTCREAGMNRNSQRGRTEQFPLMQDLPEYHCTSITNLLQFRIKGWTNRKVLDWEICYIMIYSVFLWAPDLEAMIYLVTWTGERELKCCFKKIQLKRKMERVWEKSKARSEKWTDRSIWIPNNTSMSDRHSARLCWKWCSRLSFHCLFLFYLCLFSPEAKYSLGC